MASFRQTEQRKHVNRDEKPVSFSNYTPFVQFYVSLGRICQKNAAAVPKKTKPRMTSVSAEHEVAICCGLQMKERVTYLYVFFLQAAVEQRVGSIWVVYGVFAAGYVRAK